MVRDKRILVSGGAGSIGSELVRQLAINNKIFILDSDETRTFNLSEELKQKGYWVYYRIGDVRNIETVRDVYSDFKPQIIINAAALKHVTPAQIYPREYVMTNIIGNLNLIEESKNWECFEKFVFISTDKVISDRKGVMGATKMCSERITTAMGKEFMSVRFGNVMFSRGSVLEIWKRQFENGEPLTITDIRMERYMMSIPQACELVIEAMEYGKDGEVYILDMGEKKKIIDLKEKLYPGYPIKIIGIRQGETLTEKLMTEEESKVAIKKNKFWIINGESNSL